MSLTAKIIFLILAFFSFRSFANSFDLGFGGTYTQIELPSSTSTSTSIYRGPGYLFDARMRFTPFTQTGRYSFDLFIRMGQNFTKNIGASDTHQQETLAGGIDVNIVKFLLGMQYGKYKSHITSSANTTTNLTYDMVGVKAGYKIVNTVNMGVSLCGLYEFGNALPAGDNTITTYQKVNQLSVILFMQFKLIGNR